MQEKSTLVCTYRCSAHLTMVSKTFDLETYGIRGHLIPYSPYFFSESSTINFKTYSGVIQAATRRADRMDGDDYLKKSLRQKTGMLVAASEKPVCISRWRDLKAVLRMMKYRISSENLKLVGVLVGTQKSLPD